MPKSKTNKDRKTKLNNYKTKRKKMNQPQQPGLPSVRNVPTWNPNADVTTKGFEWEVIQNTAANLQLFLQAVQSVMSRNIVNGTIKMDFEKLNPETQQYEPMTPEEKKPHADEFEKMLQTFREQAIKDAAKPVAKSTIVDAAGEKFDTAAAPQSDNTAETPKEAPKAKVVKMTESPVPEGDAQA